MLTFEAMNTGFLLAGLPPAKEAETRALIQTAHNTFSRFDPGSEISKINQLPGHWVTVTQPTFELLQDAIAAYRKTEGLFNPFLGETIKGLGYDKSFEKLVAPPDFNTAKLLLANPSPPPTTGSRLPEYLELDDNRSLVRLAPGVTLDLGGIAKGWIAQHACHRLQIDGITAGLIDAGGDIILWGRQPEHRLWGVGVANPFGENRDIADLWCEGTTAIATSSIIKRRWQTPGQSSLHHIIDPRTKTPASSDLLQVTILARDLISAEQYAKCLLILGSLAGLAWLREKRPELGFIAVRSDGHILTSDNLNQYCTELEVHPFVHIN